VAVTDYFTVDQLKATLRITQDTFDDQLQVAISAASRQIDEYCNDRFYLDATPTPRVFKAISARRLSTPSFASTTGLVVEVDMDDDGVFETTLTEGVDFQAGPPNKEANWPFTGIETLGTRFFPGELNPYFGWGYGYSPGYYGVAYGGEWWPLSQRARVRVTAPWGWPSIPSQVIQACQILSVDFWKSKDLTNGSAGTTVLSTATFGGARGTQIQLPGFNPLAKVLLCGLREPVVA
jgi:hypothetical protein